MRKKDDNFIKLGKVFKKEFPDYKVYIRRVKLPDDRKGDCTKLGKNKFLIRVDTNISEEESLETLMHELSHIFSWEKEIKDGDHNLEWGKMYSKIYRIYLEKFLEIGE